jgi:hypothetical protein
MFRPMWSSSTVKKYCVSLLSLLIYGYSSLSARVLEVVGCVPSCLNNLSSDTEDGSFLVHNF